MLRRFFRTRPAPVLADLFPLAVYLSGILWFAADTHFESFPLDDAWIHRVYSRSFATGHGFEYNPGTQEAGATSPLWAIVTSPVHWLEPLGPRAIVLGVMAFGSLFGWIVIVKFRRIVLCETGSPRVAFIAACLLALEPRLLFSSLSGMETTLLVALWLAGLHALLDRRWLWFAVWFGLTPVTRPESLLLLPMCALALWRHGRNGSIRRRCVATTLLVVPFVLWAVFCQRTTGHWLPNTYYLKYHPFHLSTSVLADAGRVVMGQGWASLLVFWAGIVLGIACLLRMKRTPTLVFLAIAPLFYVIATVGTRQVVPNGYYWTRWVDPASVLFTALFAFGYAILLGGALDLVVSRSMNPRGRRIIAALAAIGLVVCVPAFAGSFQERRSHLATDSRAIYALNVQAGLWIRDFTAPDAVVGVGDAGAIRYFGERQTIDLQGINNQTVAFHRTQLPDVLLQCDWLAIFRKTFRPARELIDREFEMATSLEIPPHEYTICDCPGQNRIVILHKRSP